MNGGSPLLLEEGDRPGPTIPFGAAPTARIFYARDAIIAHKSCAKSNARHSKGIKSPHGCTMIGESGQEANISVDAP